MDHIDNRGGAPNPFDPASLRLDQSFTDTVGVKKLLTTVPVRKPNKQDFVRVHPEPAFRLTPVAIIEIKEENETYLVTPEIARMLPGEFRNATLFTAITRQNVLHIWPVHLPDPDGRYNPWHQSAAEGAVQAMERWIRLKSNKALGAYEISEALADLPEPEWPTISFQEILQVAFRGRIVDRADHDLIRRLQGLV
jgi:hypothetical protein